MKRLMPLFVAFVASQIAATQTKAQVLTGTDAPGSGVLIVRAVDPVAPLPLVRWMRPCHPAYCLDNFLRDNRAYAHRLFPSQRYNVLVFEGGDGMKATVAARIGALGGTINVRNAGRFLLQATHTPEQLYQVIRWLEEQFGDRGRSAKPDISKIYLDAGADYSDSVASHDGAGRRGERIDTSVCVEHIDCASRPLTHMPNS